VIYFHGVSPTTESAYPQTSLTNNDSDVKICPHNCCPKREPENWWNYGDKWDSCHVICM